MRGDYESLVDRLAAQVWGFSGRNGLAGTQKDHEARLEKLELFRTEVMMLWAVVRWLSLGLLALVGLMSSDMVARLLVNLAIIIGGPK